MQRSSQNPFSPLEPEFNNRLDPVSGNVAFLVNAFHQKSHNPECSDLHSIRNTPNVGMTSGEDVESPWALMNHRQYSVREMGAGGRRDMLDSHMHGWNMEKRSKLGISFAAGLLLFFYDSCNKTAERLEDKHWYAEKQCEHLSQQFSDLVTLLNEYDDGLVARYECEYTQRGGEQFRPDGNKVKCECPT